MLKIVTFFLVLCSEIGSFSAFAETATPTKALSAVRTFEGVIKSVGFFDRASLYWQGYKEVQYCLYHKNKPIAFLVSPQDIRKKHQLRTLVGRNVRVKGIPQYVNKEPYLILLIEDVCP